MRQYQGRSFFGTTVNPIVYETGKFRSGKGWWRIKQIKPEIQFEQYTEDDLQDLQDLIEEQVNEKVAQLCDEYRDYSNLDTMCPKKKKTSKKLKCVVVSDDDTDVLPVVLPVHSIVIQDYAKPSNGLGYKVPTKEPTSEDKKKSFKGLKQNRKCSRNKQRDFKQDKASQSYLLD